MEQKTSRTLKHRVIREIDVRFDPASDDEDYFQSDGKGNIQLFKDNVKKIVDYSASSTEYHPSGHLVITPHYLKNVPNEIVSLIMDYLTEQQPPHLKQKDLYQCVLVSKQLYHLANPLLWHTPTISNASVLAQLNSSLASAQMDKALLLGNHLQRLDIQGSYWNDVDFSFMLPFIRLLDTLTIGNDTKIITCASLKYLPQCCPHLTRLSLFHTTITDEFIDAIRHHCYQLRQIDVSIKGLPVDIFKKLAKCPLEAIYLYCDLVNTRRSRMSIWGSGIYDSIIDDMKTFDQLTRLSINGPRTQSLTNTILSTNNTVAWPRLARFKMDDIITENDLISFIKSHCHLKHLDLQGQLSDSILHAIATHLPHLTHLVLHYDTSISKRGLYHLVLHCNHLKQVDVLQCYRLANIMPEFYDHKSFGISLDADKLQQIRQADQE